MKIIDLLNKIANGEEVPNIIAYDCKIWRYDSSLKDYLCEIDQDDYLFEILTRAYCDYLNMEVKIIEEAKKIPEKLKIEQDTPTSNYYIRNENGTKCALTKHSKMIAETLNQVIDYLKSKGE